MHDRQGIYKCACRRDLVVGSLRTANADLLNQLGTLVDKFSQIVLTKGSWVWRNLFKEKKMVSDLSMINI